MTDDGWASPGAGGEDDTDQLSRAMFDGDTATLYPEQRHALHALLRHRYISADTHPQVWDTLMASTDVLTSRMHDLFLDLHIDPVHRIAFKRAVPDGGEPLPRLLRTVHYTKEETILLVGLRQRFLAQRQDGDEQVFVERQTLLDEVADLRPEYATDHAQSQKYTNTAIDNLVKAGVLGKTGDPDRFKVSPVIDVLLPVERLRALWDWLRATNTTDDANTTDTADDADTAGIDLEGTRP